MLDAVVYTRELEAALAKMGGALASAPEMARAKHRIGEAALQHIRRDFVAHSRPGDPFWPPLSVVTVVLRKRGRGPMIFGEAELAARRLQVQKLRDEGLLLASLTAGGPGNIMEQEAFAVHVGTTRQGADVHQGGGSTAFSFDEAKQARFKSNVSPTIRGRRPPKPLPEGHRYRWTGKKLSFDVWEGRKTGMTKKMEGADYWYRGYWWHVRTEASPWNSLYFKLWNYMKKIHGKSRRVPRRQIVCPPSEGRLRTYGRLYEEGMAALAQRLGLGGQQAGGAGGEGETA